MTIFFTSDTHYGHSNIIKFGRGNGIFDSINHHDEVLRNNWFSTVKPEDTVYVLGDIALGDIEITLKNFALLPGRKLLVPGNHDRISSSTNSKSRIERFTPAYEEVGFEILPENTSIFIETSKGKREVLLSHFPYAATVHENAIKDKFAKYRPVNRGLPLVHGHSHSTERFNPDNKLEFHVGVDANDFKPVNISEIAKWLETLN